jgi:hypothetical protein
VFGDPVEQQFHLLQTEGLGKAVEGAGPQRLDR